MNIIPNMGTSAHGPDRSWPGSDLQRIIDSTPALIHTARPDGYHDFFNETWLNYVGCTLEDLQGMKWTASVHSEDVEGMVNAWRTSLASGEPFLYEARVRRADGQYRWMLHQKVAVRDEQENIVKWYGVVTDIEDRKRAVEALRVLSRDLQESKAKLEEAQRITHVGYWEWDILTGRVNWSDETYRIYGMQPQERPMDIAACQEKIYPEDWQRGMEEALGGGIRFNAECRVIRPTGEVRIAHFQGDVKRDASGQPSHMFGTVQDITDRKRAEEALELISRDLQESKTRLEEAQRIAHVGHWVWDLENDGLTHSDEVYRILGMRPQERPINVEAFQEMVHPEDREFFLRAVQERRGGEHPDLEFRIVRPSGEVRIVHSWRAAMRDVSGHPRQRFGIVQDITDRKDAEDKIREQESELRQILDLAPQQVRVYGPGGERLYANRIALDYYGVSLEEWRQTPGHSFRSSLFVHPDDQKRAARDFDANSSSGSAYELELRVRGADGNYRWFLVRHNPLHDDKGQVKRWYVALTDIDERKRAEERLQQENVALREEIDKASMFEEIVGTSPALRSALSRISKVAPSDSTVLITGETGTGKELVARAIHRRSDRTSRAFVSVNCAAIPRDLIASELFGHEKGSFTGATQQRLGRFELANGGTLFLDEVGELPAETQIALLRVLQEHEFERVGGTRPIRADVRVIAATNRDLQAATSAGSFRSDLFYRLNVFPIEIPSLRERREDIPLLVEYFIDRYARKAGKNIRGVNKNTLQLLQSYPWPGNIRELQNVIERSVIVCETANFSVDESWLSQQPRDRRPEGKLYLSQKVAAEEKELIEAALQECRGRVFGPSGAAAKLGIARSTLESKIRSLKINKNRFRA